jgi:fumarylacetoacetase
MRDDSPWVVTALALEDARCAAPAQDLRTPLPYLVEDDRHALDVILEVRVRANANANASGGAGRRGESGETPPGGAAAETASASAPPSPSASSPPPRAPVARSNLRHLYWTPAQMIAQHTSTGCNLRPGDLLGTGTISAPKGEGTPGCLLELTEDGARRVAIGDGSGAARAYLEDGDEVVITGAAVTREGVRIGFGSCVGVVFPALDE